MGSLEVKRVLYKSCLTRFALVLVVACLSVAIVRPVGAETVKLVTGNQYPPFADERLPSGGLATAIVRAVFSRLGYRVEIDHIDWEQGMRLTEQNQYLGSFPWFKNEERAKRFLYSDNLISSRPRLWIHTNQAASINKLEKMRGRTLCVPKGWAVESYLRGMVKGGQITRVDGTDIVDCFRKLHSRSVDAVSVDRRLGRMAADRVDTAAWVNSYQFALVPTDHFLIVSPSYPDAQRWIKVFNRALQQMQDDRSIQDVIKRYYDQF